LSNVDSIENRGSVGLIQVFDDGSRRYLRFREPPTEPVAIERGSDKKLLSDISTTGRISWRRASTIGWRPSSATARPK
jgi:hypothetical protein